jgi:hypothetical protein
VFRTIREPSPYDARWRRWFKRSRAAGRWLPFPRDEECWQSPSPAPAFLALTLVTCSPHRDRPGLACPPAL